MRLHRSTVPGSLQRGLLSVSKVPPRVSPVLTTEQLDKDDHQQLQTIAGSTVCTVTIAHGPNHQKPVHKGTQYGVRNFSNQLTNGENVGGIDTTGRFCIDGQ